MFAAKCLTNSKSADVGSSISGYLEESKSAGSSLLKIFRVVNGNLNTCLIVAS